MDPGLQEWRSSIADSSPSLLGHEASPARDTEGTQPDIIYGPEGAASCTMDPVELLGDRVHIGVGQRASASGASMDASGKETASSEQHGGTLVVAPPSVVKAVWARELASKVSTTHTMPISSHPASALQPLPS